MITVIKNNEYYRQFNAILKEEQKRVNHHVDKAIAYKRLYDRTKERSGLYILISAWLAHRYNKHARIAKKIALEMMDWCLEEALHLGEYISEQEKKGLT